MNEIYTAFVPPRVNREKLLQLFQLHAAMIFGCEPSELKPEIGSYTGIVIYESEKKRPR